MRPRPPASPPPSTRTRRAALGPSSSQRAPSARRASTRSSIGRSRMRGLPSISTGPSARAAAAVRKRAVVPELPVNSGLAGGASALRRPAPPGLRPAMRAAERAQALAHHAVSSLAGGAVALALGQGRGQQRAIGDALGAGNPDAGVEGPRGRIGSGSGRVVMEFRSTSEPLILVTTWHLPGLAGSNFVRLRVTTRVPGRRRAALAPGTRGVLQRLVDTPESVRQNPCFVRDSPCALGAWRPLQLRTPAGTGLSSDQKEGRLQIRTGVPLVGSTGLKPCPKS